jgi:hypothetical protein
MHASHSRHRHTAHAHARQQRCVAAHCPAQLIVGGQKTQKNTASAFTYTHVCTTQLIYSAPHKGSNNGYQYGRIIP